MTEELRAEKAAEEFERIKREREACDEEKTRKNREKREKKRARQKMKERQTRAQKQDGGGAGDGHCDADAALASGHATDTQAPGTGTMPRRAAGDSKGEDRDLKDGLGAAQASNGHDAARKVPSQLELQGLVIHEEDD